MWPNAASPASSRSPTPSSASLTREDRENGCDTARNMKETFTLTRAIRANNSVFLRC